jgi:hypothetical protein
MDTRHFEIHRDHGKKVKQLVDEGSTLLASGNLLVFIGIFFILGFCKPCRQIWVYFNFGAYQVPGTFRCSELGPSLLSPRSS